VRVEDSTHGKRRTQPSRSPGGSSRSHGPRAASRRRRQAPPQHRARARVPPSPTGANGAHGPHVGERGRAWPGPSRPSLADVRLRRFSRPLTRPPAADPSARQRFSSAGAVWNQHGARRNPPTREPSPRDLELVCIPDSADSRRTTRDGVKQDCGPQDSVKLGTILGPRETFRDELTTPRGNRR
jgi:hypothetical protein